ncbi:MAG: hypothetical protein NVS2B9_13630 [Myxococcales bacterium]
MRGRGNTSIVASPVLVGAVTTLIVVVSVFLAYNANKGLPFVPTYDLSAQLPVGANLVPGNEVRIGGFRVGVINQIRPGTAAVAGKRQSVAIIDMKLQKAIQPLAHDTRVIVRSRSALGLKYVQLTPGTAPATFKPGETIPVTSATQTVEFDDFLNTFDDSTRQNSRLALSGFGDALAGRGASINEAIQGLNPFFQYLQPVMSNLADRRTALNQFFRQIGATSAQVAPVANVQAQLFANMANTFHAFNVCPGCLQATIEKSPPTMDTAIRSFRVQRPFLVDFTDLSRRLIPAAQVLPRALPQLNEALAIGTPVVRSSVELNNNTAKVFAALNTLAKDPNTLLALQDLRDTLGVLNPLINYVAPFQTVCNYANYFLSGLGSHISEDTTGGTIERVLLKNDNGQQENRLSAPAYRPADIPANQDVHTTKGPNGQPLEALHAVAYPPAIDAQGNANCQVGQYGYLQGPIAPGDRYPPANAAPGDPIAQNRFDTTQSGGSHVVAGPTPVIEGPTFTGVPNLRNVP